VIKYYDIITTSANPNLNINRHAHAYERNDVLLIEPGAITSLDTMVSTGLLLATSSIGGLYRWRFLT
jgi:hypothetical protein